MIRRENYNTKQKELILETIKNQKREFTIQDIYNSLKDKTGLTTIYRLVSKLENDRYLNKHVGVNNTAYYQYLEKCECGNHFYLKCEKCGHLIHIDCDCIEELTNHIYLKHGFKLNKDKIIIEGICKKCQR